MDISFEKTGDVVVSFRVSHDTWNKLREGLMFAAASIGLDTEAQKEFATIGAQAFTQLRTKKVMGFLQAAPSGALDYDPAGINTSALGLVSKFTNTLDSVEGAEPSVLRPSDAAKYLKINVLELKALRESGKGPEYVKNAGIYKDSRVKFVYPISNLDNWKLANKKTTTRKGRNGRVAAASA